MSLAQLKHAAKKAFLIAKKFWWAILVGMLFLVVALVSALTRNGAFFASLMDLIESKQKAHAEEMKTIEDTHAAEVEEKNKRLKEHLTRMEELEKEFSSRGEKLDRKKKAELKKLVDESYNDSEKLSREIAEAFGLKHG